MLNGFHLNLPLTCWWKSSPILIMDVSFTGAKLTIFHW